MATRTKMSTKGQVIIPQEIRQEQGWQAGTPLVVESRGDHVVLRLARPTKRMTVDELIGIAGYEGPRKTLRAMDEGVMRGVREMWEREQAASKRRRK